MKDDKYDGQIIALKQFGLAVEQAGRAFAINLAPLMEALIEAGRMMYAAMWYHYILIGAPYGETRAGLTRWAKEAAAEMRTQKRLETEAAWQELLAEAYRRFPRTKNSGTQSTPSPEGRG